MPNDETNESNAKGEEVDTPVTPSEKLKAENDEMEKELLRKEELRAKIQMGGESMAGQEISKTEETPKQYTDRIEKEIGEGKHGD